MYIEQELKTHGISYEIMQQSLDQNDQNWIELACHVRQKRFGAKKPIHFNDKAKQLQFLKYRGFTPEQIKAALEGEDY